jgi:hypothetical protein
VTSAVPRWTGEHVLNFHTYPPPGHFFMSCGSNILEDAQTPKVGQVYYQGSSKWIDAETMKSRTHALTIDRAAKILRHEGKRDNIKSPALEALKTAVNKGAAAESSLYIGCITKIKGVPGLASRKSSSARLQDIICPSRLTASKIRPCLELDGLSIGRQMAVCTLLELGSHLVRSTNVVAVPALSRPSHASENVFLSYGTYTAQLEGSTTMPKVLPAVPTAISNRILSPLAANLCTNYGKVCLVPDFLCLPPYLAFRKSVLLRMLPCSHS